MQGKSDKARENLKPNGNLNLGNRKCTIDGLFEVFEYLPSRYSLVEELKKRERLSSEGTLLSIGGQAFICGSSKAKMKYEPAFEEKKMKNNSSSLQYICDPYDAAQNQLLRNKWLEESKILHGPFIPPGRDKSIDSITRSLLPTIISDLYKVITKDWENVEFSVLATEDDAIVVRFNLVSIGNECGLECYMNALIKKADCVIDYKLSKVVEDWGRSPGDGFIYYLFRPPWKKM